MKIVQERGQAKFVPEEALSLTIFKNGLWIKNGPLREYSLPEAQSFIRVSSTNFILHVHCVIILYPARTSWRVTSHSSSKTYTPMGSCLV